MDKNKLTPFVALCACLLAPTSVMAQDAIYVDGVLAGTHSLNLDPFPFGGSAQVGGTLCVNYYSTQMGMMGAPDTYTGESYFYKVVEAGMAGQFEVCDAALTAPDDCTVLDIAIEAEALTDDQATSTSYTGNTPDNACPGAPLATQDIAISYPGILPTLAGTFVGTFTVEVTPNGMSVATSTDLEVTMVMPELVLIQRQATGDVGDLSLLYDISGASDLVDEAHFCIYSNESDATGLGISVTASASAGAPVLNSATSGQAVPYAFVMSTGAAGTGTQVFNVAADGSSGFSGSASSTIASTDFATTLDGSANCVGTTHYFQVTVNSLDVDTVFAAPDYTDTVTLTITPD